MPTFIRPKYAIVEPGGGGGLAAAVVAAVVVIVAGGAAVTWLVREIMSIAVELAVAAGVFAAVMGSAVTLMAGQYRRGARQGEAALAANPGGRAAAARAAALPAGEVHYHTHYEEHQHYHRHDDQHVHLHGQAPAAEERPAIAARKVVPGVVLGATPEAIEAPPEPLYATSSEHPAPIQERR